MFVFQSDVESLHKSLTDIEETIDKLSNEELDSQFTLVQVCGVTKGKGAKYRKLT